MQVRSLSRSSGWCSARHKRMCCTHVQTWVTVCHLLKICLHSCVVINSSITSTWAFHRRLSLPHLQPHQLLRSRCRSINTATIHKMRTMALWPKQPLPQVMSTISSTTSTTQRLVQRSSRMNVDIDTEPSYSIDAELDDEFIRKAPSSPLFTEEREESANLRQTYHSQEESLLPAQSSFTRTSTGKPVYEPSSNLSQKRKSSRDLENEQIRILFERQKEQILSEVRSEIQKHELQADSDRRSIQELTGIIDSQRMGVSNPGEINYYFKKKCQNKIGLFVKLVSGICETWKNCRKVTC